MPLSFPDTYPFPCDPGVAYCAVLQDDVDFIREVKEGSTEAPDMDPNGELAKLRKKFDMWKREFKEKLKTTEEVRVLGVLYVLLAQPCPDRA